VTPPACYIGIDVGSISLNSVVVSPAREILFETTVRHQGKPIDAAGRVLTTVFEKFEQESIANISVTGSAGKLIAHLLNANFVNEIIAQARSVAYLFPSVRSVIEIGGEDAKLIRLRNTQGPDVLDIEDFEMNSVCSAGTGSFLDQQAFRLGVDISEFSRLSLLSETPPRLAGRCSVFAKSDMIHLQQIGMPVHDIVAGLCFGRRKRNRETGHFPRRGF
jgi:activator of 2-hydroxyglutaryl-CoA dehydratase